MSVINGFYAGYFAGAAGNGVALFVMKDAILTGIDMSGVTFDGTYKPIPDSKDLAGEVRVRIPPNVTTVQGITAGPTPIEYTVELSLPQAFADEPFIQLKTPYGVVNVKMKKMRELV